MRCFRTFSLKRSNQATYLTVTHGRANTQSVDIVPWSMYLEKPAMENVMSIQIGQGEVKWMASKADTLRRPDPIMETPGYESVRRPCRQEGKPRFQQMRTWLFVQEFFLHIDRFVRLPHQVYKQRKNKCRNGALICAQPSVNNDTIHLNFGN
jgi:hypothetical protein